MFHSANDAEAVASKRLRVELQTYIHILPSGRAKALSGSLGGIDLQRQRHVVIVALNGGVHQSGTSLSLQKSLSNGSIEALAILPHTLLRVKLPVVFRCVERLVSVHLPGVWQQGAAPARPEVAEVGFVCPDVFDVFGTDRLADSLYHTAQPAAMMGGTYGGHQSSAYITRP